MGSVPLAWENGRLALWTLSIECSKGQSFDVEDKPVLPKAVETSKTDLQQRHGTQKLKATDGCEL